MDKVEDIVGRLFDSDAASALTNEAARFIQYQQAIIEEMRSALMAILAVSEQRESAKPIEATDDKGE